MNFDERYGTLDRLLHRVAFRAGTAQHSLADVEELLYEGSLPPLNDPVFITALPRAGTTILLRLLWHTSTFASHTYQDMPFVLCPMLWSRFSRQFHSDETCRERAHGDGLSVSSKSPESFEEMVWKHFWPTHYREDHILPWEANQQKDSFNRFFVTHMRKIAALRGPAKRDKNLRYLSKNNLNIARLATPPQPLSDGTFLIPFRDPVQQAASMLRQHERFLSIHDDDDFVREYMEAIGHHEFGEGLKPVNFDDWLSDADSPRSLSFWVQYWIAAYQYVLTHATDDTVLVSYARLTDDPEPSLSRLAHAVGVSDEELVSQADDLKPPRTHAVKESSLPPPLRQQASELYDRLDERARV